MEIERRGEVAVLHLRGGKANAMTLELLERLHALVADAALSDAAALVVTGYDTFFSGGLALPVLVGLDRARMRNVIDRFGGVMFRLFTFDRPVVAAVNGHAIAGGCVLALQCDARLMVDGGAKIGLNETQLGIGLPASVIEPLRLAVPAASWSAVALEGRLFAPDEALRVGLVDALHPAAGLLDAAVARARQLASVPRAGFAQVKAALRRPAVEAIARGADEERERWLDTWFSRDAQARLAAAVAKLART